MNKNLKEAIKLLKRASAFIDVIKFECGEDVDSSDLENEINEFIERVKEKE